MKRETLGDNGKPKEQWGNLATDRLDEIASRRDQLEREIQQACRIVKELSAQHFGEFEERNKHRPL